MSAPRRKKTFVEKKVTPVSEAVDANDVDITSVWYIKITNRPVHIRKGPGLDFNPTGKYIDKNNSILVVEEQNGFGLLNEYKETRDGWVLLSLFDRTE